MPCLHGDVLVTDGRLLDRARIRVERTEIDHRLDAQRTELLEPFGRGLGTAVEIIRHLVQVGKSRYLAQLPSWPARAVALGTCMRLPCRSRSPGGQQYGESQQRRNRAHNAIPGSEGVAKRKIMASGPAGWARPSGRVSRRRG